MPKPSVLVPATALAAVLLCGPAFAGSLSCRSVNGNVSCAGSGGTSCQTVDGRTVCVGGNGDAVQAFGGGQPPPDLPELGDDGGAPDDAAVPPVPPAPRLRIERGGPGGPALLLRRDGRSLHLLTDRLSVDIE
jgi:hypothetical protein